MYNSEQQNLFDLPPVSVPFKNKEESNLSRSGTFTDNMKLPVHRWFRYSAGFSGEWAENLIRKYSPSFVLDPFAGSGTTLLAANAAGVFSFGYESHPFVVRIASAKICWNQKNVKLLEAKKELVKVATNNKLPLLINVPDLMEKIYTPEVLQRLYALRDAYYYCYSNFDPEISKLLWLAITAILRSCSFVGTAQCQYVLPKHRKLKSLDPFTAFELKIADMATDMEILKSTGYENYSKIILHDARIISDQIPHNSIDLVVTSPPYPNNFDYADATRLEMTFWGEIQGWKDLQKTVRQFIIRSCSQHATAEKLILDNLIENVSINSIREELIVVCNKLSEIRQTKGGKKAYHTMIAAYFCDLSKIFQSLRYVCKTNSTLCFVIGDSAPYGVYVPVNDWLGKLAIAAGFKEFHFEKIRDRNIKWKNRKHRVPLHEGYLWIKG